MREYDIRRVAFKCTPCVTQTYSRYQVDGYVLAVQTTRHGHVLGVSIIVERLYQCITLMSSLKVTFPIRGFYRNRFDGDHIDETISGVKDELVSPSIQDHVIAFGGCCLGLG